MNQSATIATIALIKTCVINNNLRSITVQEKHDHIELNLPGHAVIKFTDLADIKNICFILGIDYAIW